MARIEKMKDFFEATETVVGVDMGIVELAFPRERTHVAPQIQYDVRTMEGKTAKFTSFSESANVIEKDGKATITLDAFEVNDKIPFSVFDLEAEKFGMTEYDIDGGYSTDPVVMAEKVHLGAKLRLKKLASSVLAYGNLTKARDGIEADFNIPAGNFTVLTTGLWNTAGAKPIADIKAQVRKMKVKPKFVIMGADTWSNFVANGDDVVLNDNATNRDKPRNVYLNENAGNGDFVRVAKIVEAGAMLDIYVDSSVDENSEYTFPDGFAAFGNMTGGEVHYRGIPYRDSRDGMARLHAGKWAPLEIHETDPDIDAIAYRSGFLPVAKQNEAFGSIKAY